MRTESVRTTIAICAYNPDPPTITRALDALVPQAVDDDIELVLVDNNSSPPLREQDYLTPYDLRIVEQPIPGLTAAREAAFAAATGELVVFADDDNVLCSGYVAGMRHLFEADDRLGVAGGSVEPEYEVTPPRWFTPELEEWLAVKPYGAGETIRTDSGGWSTFFPVGAGIAVRRSLALAYMRDCDETVRIEGRRGAALSSGEDIDLCLYALSVGSTLLVTGQARVVHIIQARRLEPRYLGDLAVSNVRSSLELERKWAPRLGRPVFPMFQLALPALVLRAAVCASLSVLSPKYRIKTRALAALVRARMGREI